MAMQSDSELTGAPRGGIPGLLVFWLWLLVVAFGALAIFSGYTALSKNQLYWESELARQTLEKDKVRLEANVADLKLQLDQVNKAQQETASALKQSRANTETASAKITDLQGQVSDLQAKTETQENKLAAAQDDANGLESKLAAAEVDAKQAAAGKAAAEQEVETLKRQLADTQKKLDTALAAQSVQQTESPSPVP